MRLLISLSCFLIAYSFTGCSECSTKKVTCGAFEDNVFFAWFSYQSAASGVFKNTETQDSIFFNITNADTSKSYETTIGGFGRPNTGTCEAFAAFYGKFDDSLSSFNINYNVLKGINNSYSIKVLDIHFKNGYWHTGEITDQTFLNDTSNNISSIAMQQNVLFENGNTYTSVITLTGVTIQRKETGMPYKIFIAKGHGIIGFETYPLRQKWVLQ